MASNLMQDRIDPTKRVQLVSDDGKVRIIYEHFDLGMKFRVQVDIGNDKRQYWTTVSYSNSWLTVLSAFNRIVADRAKGGDA